MNVQGNLYQPAYDIIFRDLPWMPKVNLKTSMVSYLVGLEAYNLAWAFGHIPILFMAAQRLW